ncbi:MAG: MFS transporter [Verrucomicrobia bacterium]|nr:MAG: MFS transporter [Verrucomicrobiota bacterium]
MQTALPAPAPPRRFPEWLRILEPAPPSAALTEPREIQAAYTRWQRRVLLSTTAGYAVFYFVRKNLSAAQPVMEHDLGLDKSTLGLFLTLHGVLYGVSKFANGFVADRSNARVLMVIGLAASALMNIFFGLSSTAISLGVFWMLNGWVQGMGFPPCARLLSHWFPPKIFAMKMSIWNTSHCIGAGLIMILCGQLAQVQWRLCFLVPAVIAFAFALILWRTLPDTPPSVGLPEVEGTQSRGLVPQQRAGARTFLSAAMRDQTSAHERISAVMQSDVAADRNVRAPAQPDTDSVGQSVLSLVFANKYIWLVAIANFFVYILRYAVFDWGTTMLKEAKHVGIGNASLMVAGFEAAGAIGAMFAGWLADRFFGGRPMRPGIAYMILAAASLLLLWKFAGDSRLLNTSLLCAAGFFIYGPQCLIGIAAAKLATKQAAGTAVGLTSLFGYLSTLFSGWGLGTLVQHHGWDAGFAGLIGVALIGTLLFIAAWKAKPDGYTATGAVVQEASTP